LERFSERIMQCHMTLEGPVRTSTPTACMSTAQDTRISILPYATAFNNAKRQLQDLHRDRFTSTRSC
jgi:hypothetical protein